MRRAPPKAPALTKSPKRHRVPGVHSPAARREASTAPPAGSRRERRQAAGGLSAGKLSRPRTRRLRVHSREGAAARPGAAGTPQTRVSATTRFPATLSQGCEGTACPDVPGAPGADRVGIRLFRPASLRRQSARYATAGNGQLRLARLAPARGRHCGNAAVTGTAGDMPSPESVRPPRLAVRSPRD